VTIFTFSIPANTGKFLPVSVFGVLNTGIPVSVYTGLETLIVSGGGKFPTDKKCILWWLDFIPLGNFFLPASQDAGYRIGLTTN
jgi:hypothetical protein